MTPTIAAPAAPAAKPVYTGDVEAREANEWWDSLPADRRCSIHRWISGGPPPPLVDADQLTIDDALGRTHEASTQESA